MTYQQLIKDNLRRLGQDVTVHRAGEERTVRAVIESRRGKNKLLFEDHTDAAGRYYNDYYTYIGPADTDVTLLTEEDWLAFGGHRFAPIRCEAVCAAGEVLYYEGILKRIWEEEDVFTQGM